MPKLNKNIKFNYYSGDIKKTRPLGLITLEQFINAHESPTDDTKTILNLVKESEGLTKRKLKHKLYAFTPSVIIKSRGSRCYKDIVSWTGLMQLDFDKLKTKEDAIQLKHHLFNNYDFVLCSYLSPSELGIKCIIKTTVPKNKEHYKALHKAICNEFNNNVYFDKATNNAVLPLFLSMDNDILYIEHYICSKWKTEDWSEPEYVELLDNKHNFKKHETTNYYYNKTIRIFEDKINSISNNGHTQLRSACLILGSRVGADYIDQNDAHALADNLVRINNYLKKGTKGYISTAHWAINEGIKNPKYYR